MALFEGANFGGCVREESLNLKLGCEKVMVGQFGVF